MANNLKIDKTTFLAMMEDLESYTKSNIEHINNLTKAFPNSNSANFMCEYSSNLFASVINLLSYLMNDKVDAPHLEHNWIEYFIYELDFGKENEKLKAYDKNGKEIKLSNASELYDYLKTRK